MLERSQGRTMLEFKELMTVFQVLTDYDSNLNCHENLLNVVMIYNEF